jgi:FixJ family two-component response regulator
VVAIVDDDASIRRATQNLLESAGFPTLGFPGAASFLASDRLGEVACLVADMRMPGMTGLGLHLALVASGSAVPTILVTAYPDEGTRERARNAGILCYLAKPFSEEELLECVRSAIATRGVRGEGQ